MSLYMDFVMQVGQVLQEVEYPEVSVIVDDVCNIPRLFMYLDSLVPNRCTTTIDIVHWKYEPDAITMFLESGVEAVWKDYIAPKVFKLAVDSYTYNAIFDKQEWKNWIALMIEDIFTYSLDASTAIECAICLDKIGEGTRLHCKHQFHSYCIAKWELFNQSCPTCRANMHGVSRPLAATPL